MTLNKSYSPFSSQSLHLPTSTPSTPMCACAQRLPSASLCHILTLFKDSRNCYDTNKNLPAFMAVWRPMNKGIHPLQYIFLVMSVSCIDLFVFPAWWMLYMRSLIECHYSHCSSLLTRLIKELSSIANTVSLTNAYFINQKILNTYSKAYHP